MKHTPNVQDLRQFIVEHPFPTDLLIETTSRCNLACTMCPQDRLTRPVGAMSFELWKKIVDEVAARSPSTRLWPALMGEPLMTRGEIFDFVRYAKDAGIGAVHLNSNLMLFRPTMMDALFASGVDEIIVGLDAATAGTYAKVRVKGDYDTVVRNVFAICEERERRGLTGPRIVLQYIVMDENEAEERAFVDFWRASGLRVSLKLKARTGWGAAVPVWTAVDEAARAEAQRLPCTWLLRQMTVFWDGRVPQCDGDWDGSRICGDINVDRLEDVWQGELKRIRDAHLRGFFDFSPCRDCTDWSAGRSTWVECG